MCRSKKNDSDSLIPILPNKSKGRFNFNTEFVLLKIFVLKIRRNLKNINSIVTHPIIYRICKSKIIKLSIQLNILKIPINSFKNNRRVS